MIIGATDGLAVPRFFSFSLGVMITVLYVNSRQSGTRTTGVSEYDWRLEAGRNSQTPRQSGSLLFHRTRKDYVVGGHGHGMLDMLTSGTGIMVGLVAIVGVIVAIMAIRFAVKMAIRVGIVATVVLASLYAVGVIG